MAEKEKKAKEPEQDDTITKVEKLQKRIYKACGNLDENMSSVGEPLYKEMLNHYHTQYMREYELMNAQDLIDVDKQIEQLKIQRIKDLAVIEAERVECANELQMLREVRQKEFELEKDKLEKEFKAKCDKELGEIQLAHDKIKEDIRLKKQKLDDEIQLLWDTTEQEARLKYERLVPAQKPRFRLFGLIPVGRVKYNQPMHLAFESVEIDTKDYLMSRSQAIAEKNSQYEKKYGLNAEEEPAPDAEQEEPISLSRTQRKRLLKRIKRLSKRFKGLSDQQTVEIGMQLEGLISSAEEANAAFVPEELTEKDRQKVLKEIEEDHRRQLKEEKKQRKNKKKVKENVSEESATETQPVQENSETPSETENVSEND